MRYRRAYLFLGVAITLVLVPGTTFAYWDWVDEFTSAEVHLRLESGTTANAYIRHFYDNLTTSEEPRPWANLGSQTVAGRFNAVEKVQWNFKETSTTTCGSVTVSIARWREPNPPAEGSSCTAAGTVGKTSVGSASFTSNTCGNGNADATYVNRLKPTFSFALEGGVSPPTVGGYFSRVRLVGSMNDPDPFEMFGCFKIWWFSP